MSEKQLTLASDEYGEEAFVMVDEHAPTAEAVCAAFPAAAKEQWGIVYAEPPEPEELTRRWYKTDPKDDERFIECGADDPEREAEWWRFELGAEADR